MLPIIIMTRNEGPHLKTCVESIISTASVSYHIYIVDNASTCDYQISYLEKIRNISNITVVKNSSNNWVLGINRTLELVKERYSSKYFFLTDGDIDFSDCKFDKYGCWLDMLINKMESNSCIGKIGLSLDWSVLNGSEMYNNILKQEKSLYNEKKIGDLHVSFVDTTATLFLTNWSVEGKPCLYPDHMRYLRPELYSCRTPRNVVVKHLGWLDYGKTPNKLGLNSKVFCFTKLGGYIQPDILNNASPFYKYSYLFFSRPIFKLWVLRRYYFSFKYFLEKLTKGYHGHG